MESPALIEAKVVKQREKANTYANHKSVSQGLLSTAVFQQLIATLIWVWTNDITTNALEIALTVLIVVGLVNQLIIYSLLCLLVAAKSDQTYLRIIKIRYLNLLTTYLSGIGLIISIAITAIYSQLQSQ